METKNNFTFEMIKIILKENKKDAVYFTLSFIIFSLLEVASFSYILSKIITSIQDKSYNYNLLKIYAIVTLIYIIVYYTNKYFEYNILAIFQQKSRSKLIEILLKSNTIYYLNKNYNNYVSPINRMSGVMGNFFRNFLTGIVPYIFFIILIPIVLLKYFDLKISIFFIITTIIIFAILYFSFPNMAKANKEYEKEAVNIETDLIENCNNMDKIVYRGMVNSKYNEVSKITDKVKKGQIDFNQQVSNATTSAKFIQDIIIFPGILLWLMYKKYDIKISLILITLLALYKSKGDNFFILMNMLMDTYGRKNTVEYKFYPFLDNYNIAINQKFSRPEFLRCSLIEFNNVSFSYNKSKILKNINLKINFDETKVVGIYGPSGYGKSTLVKLLIKLYKPTNGDVLINNINIKNIDSDYLKKKIIYINQEQKLFDTNIKNNINYGCNNCVKSMNELKKIKHIFKSFPKNFLYHKAGFSGNKLSGGQRQIINVINGLITPSEVLILDEPTSSLDYETKKDLIDIVNIYKKEKRGIIIITHDPSLMNIFDRIINIKEINGEKGYYQGAERQLPVPLVPVQR